MEPAGEQNERRRRVGCPAGRAPAPHQEILIGLWQQREELGLVADELLALFQAYGMTPPLDEEGGIKS